MKSLLRRPIVGAIGIGLMLAMTAAPTLAQFETEYDPGTPQFQRTWDRTDKPVEDGVLDRTWNWGPGRTEVMMEEYTESPDQMRQVQYFDKSRMEINHPDAPDDELWYVTNGLLVVEMVDGMMQIGDTDFVEREPADVNIVGDPGNEFSPTYADINAYGLREAPADEVGDLITRTLTEDGQIVEDEVFAEYGVTAEERVTVPGIDHTVAGPFWDFMNSTGPVWEDGENVDDLLFPNPFYAVGLPITGAFWTTATVAETETDVLWQCFERRCLTYTPRNEEGFQVEAGNVGQHYWTWRYEQEPTPPPSDGEFDGNYFTILGPISESGVTGSASLSLEGDQLTVEIEASGLTPDQEHMQHIHGFEDGETVSTCLDAESYGGVLIPLEPFPTADSEGNISYSETLTIDPQVLMDPTQRAIVLHGMELDGEYNAGLPVACGEIQEGDLPPPPETESYSLMFGELNNSGVSASGSAVLADGELTVTIDASGLEADMTHPQHIHGLAEGSAFCPGPDFDADADGMVDIEEGGPAYGDVLQPLFLDVEAEAYPTAGSDGGLTFEMTYMVDPETVGDLGDRVVVLHGMTVGEEYVEVQPVACALVVPDELPAYAAPNLSGDNVRPEPVSSDGSGDAGFWYDESGDELYYMLSVNDLDDVNAAHIHQGGVEDSGDVVAPLFVAEEASYGAFGILSSGRVAAADLPEGVTVADLVAMFGSGDVESGAYVNVHTDTNAGGEIRDQVGEVTAAE